MKTTISNNGLDMSGLLGFEHIDLGTANPQDAVADAFNKIGEARNKTVLDEMSLDVSGLLGFEHLDVGATNTEEAVAEAFNKIGEVKQ